MIEEENTLLRKEVDEKSEVIAQWIRTIPNFNHSAQMANPSHGMTLFFAIFPLFPSEIS